MEMYRLMGYSETQLMQIQQFALLQHGGLFWSSVVGFVPVFGYLLYVRKFFGGTANDNAESG